jgi:glycerol-3-phosphate acyltransferase PlsY
VTDTFLAIILMIMGYLTGSIPTGYLIARMRGIDIQKVGSGNIGATNVLRNMGILPAVFVVLIDPLKGFLITLFPLLLGMDAWIVAATGVATILGNHYNIFLRLRGGKGVATSLGVFLAVEPLITLLILVLGVTTIALARMVSLGSLIGVLAAPLMLLGRGNFIWPYFALAVAIVLLTFYKHRDNIQRLSQGVERRLGDSKKVQEIR